MKKNTKYKRKKNIKQTIICILLLIIITSFLIYFLIKATHIIEIIAYILLLILIFGGLISIVVGISKGKIEIFKERMYVKKTNPYIYYRELPNNYGIGVNFLLIDSTIENHKDIIAVILDLCARNYMSLIKQKDKYLIKILKNVDNNLLTNEEYILNLIISNNLKNIDYQKWYDYCIEDGNALGLYYRDNVKISNEALLKKELLKKRSRRHFKISLLLSILILIQYIINDNSLLHALSLSIFYFFIIYGILFIPFYLLNTFTAFKNISNLVQKINYKNIKEQNLVKTKKGIEEIHKLYTFKAFIRDFGNFASKKPEEIILWERYLSYAQVFNLNKEIMKSGYKELIENSAFQIDNINNITLYNIEIINN